ncbi:MAG TPA: hypothetical protein VMP01_12485 [Pirellulaceae bacterium]|nr:hypothetical protein [Pirellulaceae bacterium]
MLEILFILLLSGHLMLANVAAGGPLVCIWLEWKARGNRDPLASQAADYLATWSLGSLLGGAVVGVLLGAMLWNDAYRDLWMERLGHKARWAIGEFGVSLAVIAGYWLWRKARPGASAAVAAVRMFLLVFTSTNLLYHFPPLFLVAARLSDAGASGPAVTPALFRQEMARGEVASLSTHFTLASLAMVGVLLLGLALRHQRRGGSDEEYGRLARWGGWIGLVPSLLQLPVGLWVLGTISATMQSRLMGSHLLATGCFLLGLLGALWLMRELAAIALGERERSQLIRVMALMVAVVVLMTAGQQLARVRPAANTSAAATLH